MSARTFQLFSRNSSAVLIVFLIVTLPAYAQLFPKARPDNVIKPKNIHGVVQDLRGSPLPGARVYLKDMKSRVVRTLEADQTGEYKVFALSPTVDYELYAEFKGKASEKKYVSAFLNREDNVLNFQLDVEVTEAKSPEASAPGIGFKRFELSDQPGSLEIPSV